MRCGDCTKLLDACDDKFRHKPEKLLKLSVVVDVVDLPRGWAIVRPGEKVFRLSVENARSLWYKPSRR